MAFEIDVFPANEVWLDLFPAKVYDETQEFVAAHEEYRVIVTDTYFYVIDDTIEGPKAIIAEPMVSFSGTNKTGYVVYTEYRHYTFGRAPNCGCGSRIRGLFPFAGIPQTRPV